MCHSVGFSPHTGAFLCHDHSGSWSLGMPDLKFQTGVVARRIKRRKLFQEKGSMLKIWKVILWKPEIRLLLNCMFMPSSLFLWGNLEKKLALDASLFLTWCCLRLHTSLITCKDLSVGTNTYARLIDGCVCLSLLLYDSAKKTSECPQVWRRQNPSWKECKKNGKTKWWLDVRWGASCSSKPSFLMVSWKNMRYVFWCVFNVSRSVVPVHCFRC